MTRKFSRFTLVGLLVVALCQAALAQRRAGADKGTLDKETFMNMESVSNPAISPDGKEIVFTRSWVDKVKDEHVSNLWIVDVDGTRPAATGGTVLRSGRLTGSESRFFRIATARINSTLCGLTR